MAYIFGGNTGISSPAEAKRLRDIAEALAGQRRMPHTIGEGLSAIGDAIASRRSADRADRMEREGRAAYESKYGDLLKNAFGGDGGAADPVPTAPGGEVPPLPDLSQAHPEYLTGGGMPPPPAMQNVANQQLPPAEDLNAIVRTVIGEAGNQSPEGQRAVAEVILNRARATGQTPMQVVSAKGQFEPWQTRGAELNAIDPNSQAYQSVLGNIAPAFGPDDPTGGADHFYSPGAQAALGRDTPDWARGQQGRDIGDQRFYNLAGADPPAADDVSISSYSPPDDATAGGEQTAGLSIDAEPGQQPQQQPGVQVADSGNGFDPRLIEALSDPWIPDGQKAVLEELLKQQLKANEPVDYGITTEGGDFYRTNPRTGQVEKVLDNPDAPEKPTPDMQNFQFDKANGFEGSFHDWMREKTARPPAPFSFTTENGDIYTQDPNTGKVTKAIDNPDKPEKPPAGVQEYEYAAAHGFKGTFEEWQKLKDPMVTVNTGDVSGDPGEKKQREAAGTKEGERWDAMEAAGSVSGATKQDLLVLDEVIKTAPQGPLTGKLAEMFPGFTSSGAVFNSITKRIAPTLRTPGSGSTSDIEYEGMLNSMSRLSNYPEANKLINEMMKAKADVNVERADVVTAWRNEELTSKEARKKLSELNKRSIMSPKMRSLLDNVGGKDEDVSKMSDEQLLKDLGL